MTPMAQPFPLEVWPEVPTRVIAGRIVAIPARVPAPGGPRAPRNRRGRAAGRAHARGRRATTGAGRAPRGLSAAITCHVWPCAGTYCRSR
jgi:hypothetical protein